MPIYEYRCSNGHSFEVFQRMSDPPSSACEVCGVAGVEKVLFPVAVHFKGKGFYSTDYGKGSRKGSGTDGDGASGEKSSSGSSDSGSSSSGSSDSSSSGSSTSSSSDSGKSAPSSD